MTFIKGQKQRWRLIKRKKQILNFCNALIFIASLATPTISHADNVASNALPTGAVTDGTLLSAGSATYNTSGLTHTVTMNTAFVRTRYGSFNIGRDATVNINGFNGSGTFVARVLSSGGMSHIYGTLNAPGVRVFIMNGNGTTFYAGSTINVGSLLATTAQSITSQNGNTKFTFSNFGNGEVINNTDITVSDGGFAVLAAPYVENNGNIKAKLGTIILASTNNLTLDLQGDGTISFANTAANLSRMGVTNTGALTAKSGTVEINASLASSMVESVVNLDGIIDADSFSPGQVAGNVVVSASLSKLNMDGAVTAKGTNTAGGSVDITTTTANLHDEADIDVSASGSANAGSIHINTLGLNVDEGAKFTAKGGSISGNGGNISITHYEGSFAGDVDASATSGTAGKLSMSGGSNLVIDDSANSPVTGTMFVSAETLENLLQNGTSLDLSTETITLGALTDGNLQGGSGNISFTANGDILFTDNTNSISSVSGGIDFTSLLGNINIGRLEVTGITKNGEGHVNLTTNSGNIALTGISSTASRSAGSLATGPIGNNITIDSAGNIIVNGDITAIASDAAATADVYSAISLTAGKSITMQGNITADASFATAYSGSSKASVDINTGSSVTDILDINGDITVRSGTIGAAANPASVASSSVSANNNGTPNINNIFLVSSGDTIFQGNAINQNTTFLNGFNTAGFDPAGYDQNGFDANGFNRNGFDINGFDINGFDVDGFDHNGFDITGFDRNGFDINGYDHNGFDVDGFNASGFDVSGFDRNGFDIDGYNRSGFNASGFDRDGFDTTGFNLSGIDRDGYNRAGFDAAGFNRRGFDIAGIHRDTGTNFDPNGFDVNGNPRAVAGSGSGNILVTVLNSHTVNSFVNIPAEEPANNNRPVRLASIQELQNIAPAAGGNADDVCNQMNCNE